MSVRKLLPDRRRNVAIREDELRRVISSLAAIVAYETNTLATIEANARCVRPEASKRAADEAAGALAQLAFGLMEATHAK